MNAQQPSTHYGLHSAYPATHRSGLIWLKRAIWLYLILLLLEGALRKWVAPEFSTPLLLIRDPIAAFIVVESFRRRLMPDSPAFYLSLLLGWLGIVLAVVMGHGSLPVALYGARPLFLHFPAMFMMALVLDRDDLIRIGKFLLVTSLVMTPLIIWQFYSPQSAWVNQGVNGEGSSAGFSGALGYFRPPGTFSFTSGVAQFYSVMAVFLLYFWLSPGKVGRGLLLAATMALVVALPFSVSRTLLFQAALTLGFATLAVSTSPRVIGRAALVAVALMAVLFIFSQLGFFRTALDVMEARFTLASLTEGGLEGTLVDRYLGGLLAAFIGSKEWPFWGLGLGMGTNVGAVLLSGEARFLIAEGEWQRWVGELGLLLGSTLILMRLAVTGVLVMKSGSALLRGDLLPWMLMANMITLLPQGSWNQPTALGFSILSGALLMASIRRPNRSSVQQVTVLPELSPSLATQNTHRAS